MYFSRPEEINQTSFTILKSNLEQDNRRRRIQDRNQIKVNKRKLPSDFFKRPVQRSLPHKSALDSQSNRLSLPRTTVLRKYPQTERKIKSFNDLPESTQIDHMQDFNLTKTQKIRQDDGQRFSTKRKVLIKEIDTSLQQFQNIRLQKCIDYVMPKCFNRKQAAQLLQTGNELRNLLKQKFPNKFGSEEKNEEKTNVSEEFEMGCTFGKGFRKQKNSSLENSKVLKDELQISVESSNQNSHGQKYQGNKSLQKKSSEQKSTEESQIYQGSKSNENSPLKAPHSSKIILGAKEASHFEHPKFNKIQWNIYNQELSIFDNPIEQKSKDVFTAEEKERKSKYRVNNSSNDCREKVVRKDKKLGQICLPRINKV